MSSEQAPPGLDSSWVERELHGLAQWRNGLAFRASQFGERGMPVIKIAELKNGLSSQTNYTAQEFDDELRVAPRDILFGWSGSPETSIDTFRWSGPDGWLNQHVFKVTAVEGVDQDFLFALLRSLRPRFIAIARDKQTTGLGHVTIRDLKAIRVRLPPLDEQRRIAGLLAAFDDKIESSERLGRNLKRAVQTSFDHLLRTSHEHARAATVRDLCQEVRNGGTPSRSVARYWEGDVPWFKTGELTDDFLPVRSAEAITHTGLAESNCQLMPRGTVLLAIYAAPTVGRLGILDGEAACNQACTALVPLPEVGYPFLFFTLLSLRARFNLHASGSAQQNISKSIVETADALVPSDDELARFNALALPAMELVASLRRESSIVRRLRDALLPKLVCGEIRLPEDYEPGAAIGVAA